MKKIFYCLAIATVIIACKKTELAFKPEQEFVAASSNQTKNPSVLTHPITANSAIQAFVRGEIINGTLNNYVDKGFCYKTTPNPTVNDNIISGTPDTYYPNIQFTALIQGLTPATTYYVKAYVKKNNGSVIYGNQESVTTLAIGNPDPGVGPVTDIDGNVYNSISYNGKVWMVENLKTTHYRDGSPITNITNNTTWGTATSEAYCDYDNNSANAAAYGRLYNLFAVKDSRNIAPAGWHVASYSEWQSMINYLGGGGIAGGRMKETGFNHWLSPNTGADNSSGFTAVGSGWRSSSFAGLQQISLFWNSSCSISSINDANINAFILRNNSADYSEQRGYIGTGATFGYSVRCVKD